MSPSDRRRLDLAARHLRRWVWSERRRNALSVLGFVVGVAVTLVALAVHRGEGRRLRDDLRLIGAATLSVVPERGPLPLLDEVALAAALPEARRLARVLWSVTEVRGLAGERVENVALLGIDSDFFRVIDEAPVRGRRISDLELQRGAPVALLGRGLARRLGNDRVVLWQQLALPVLGILDAPVREGVVRSSIPAVLGEALLVPRDVLEASLLGRSARETWLVEARAPGQVEALRNRLRSWLAERTGVAVTVESAAEALRQEGATRSFLAWSLAAIGGTSLALGGIGLMNNMLSLVLERRAEIGLRRALGASPRDVGLQFLTEVAVVALAGSAAGAVLGLGALPVLRGFGVACELGIGAAIGPPVVGLALGLMFGAVPATRAARCAPIETLRPLT